jgi:hypothetical protein
MGVQTLKNIAEPMRAWRMQVDANASAAASIKLPVETALACNSTLFFANSAAIPVWNTLQQAELDLQAVIRQLPSSLHKWGFGIVLFVGFMALSALNSPHANRDVRFQAPNRRLFLHLTT